ncbi:MAG: cell division protein FtsQ/DivIB [Candidatus Gastranaerophilaceae bacterium]
MDNLNQHNEKVKKKRIAVRASKPLLFLRALFIALIIFAGYKLLSLPMWYYPKDMFKTVKNKNFAIMGTYITPNDKVLAVMRKVQMPKVPLYMLDVKAFEDRISEIETVKSVHVRRYWLPARLQIVIEDKRPILIIAPDEKAKPAAFFVEGATLLSADLLPKDVKKYPLKVLTTGSDPKDNFIKWKEERIDSLLYLAGRAAEYTGSEVEYIDIRNPNDVYIKTKPVLIRLGEMNDTAYTRLASITTILPNLSKIEQKIKYVDLRWDVTKYVKIEGEKDEDIINSNELEIG